MLNINIVFVAMVVVVLMILGMILVYGLSRAQQRLTVRQALIEKYSSAKDLNDLMQTPAGRRLFAEFSTGGNPLKSVLSSVQLGILGILAGVGTAGIGVFVNDKTTLGVGGLLGCIGLGFLISAAITYRLSKSWGMVEKRD